MVPCLSLQENVESQSFSQARSIQQQDPLLVTTGVRAAVETSMDGRTFFLVLLLEQRHQSLHHQWIDFGDPLLLEGLRATIQSFTLC